MRAGSSSATRCGFALGVLLLVGVACRSQPTGPEKLIHLLPESRFSEVRSDNLDLGLLMGQAVLLHDGIEIRSVPLRVPYADRLTLQLPFATTGDKELRLTARANRPGNDRLSLNPSLNGNALGRLRLSGEVKDFRISLPSSAQRVGVNEFSLELHRGQGGFELKTLEVRDRSGESVPPTGEESRGLFLPAGSQRRFAARLDGVTDLVLVARTDNGARLTASAETEVGSMALMPEAQGRIRRRLAIHGRAGDFLRIDLDSRGKGGVWIEELALASPSSSDIPAPISGEERNIVIFLSDTLRADHLGAYGYRPATSPRFDAFARTSLLFENAQAVSSWTRPTVASLFTGLGVVTHGVGGPRHPLEIGLDTMAEAARTAGFKTAAFVANPVVPDSFSRGFETWEAADLTGRRAHDVTAAALRWIATATEPFLLYVHVLEPHAPYEPLPEHWKGLRPAEYSGDPNPVAVLSRGRHDGRLEASELSFIMSAYDAEIHEMDAAFGGLLDGLRERGLLDKSLVLFTADHGEEFFDHGGEGHGSTLYEEVVRSPLALRVPGRSGRSLGMAVDQSDLAPTLLALGGVKPPRGMEGRNLSPFLSGQIQPLTEPLRLAHLHFGEEATEPNLYSVRVGSLKLIVHHEVGRSPASRLELFDLASDPRETRNLAAERPLVTGYLLSRAEAARVAQGERRDLLGAGRPTARPEGEEALKALGYVR